MTRGNLSLVIPMVALLMLAVGVINEEQKAYASGQDPFIWCDIDGEWERGDGFWTEGTCMGDLIGDREGEFEVDVEVHGEFEVGDHTEGRCREVSTELTIYSGNGGLEGTITAEAEGEICRNGSEGYPEPTTTWQELEITGATGDFSTIVGSYEGEFHSEMEREEGEFEATIHAYLIIAEHGQVVEVHCEVEYEFEMFLIFGERHGYGECVYIFADGFEEEHEVEVGGEFEVGSLIDSFRTIEGTFHIEDYEGNALWLFEEGAVEIDCDIETEEEEEEETPYCLETEATVEEGEGIFSFLDGEGTRTAEGYFTTHFIFTEGYAVSTIWIFFECPECEPEEEEEADKPNGGGCDNCEPPTLGLNKAGDQRMVDGGFTCNGQTVDVENYYTEFPTITNAVGQRLQCTFIIYEDTYADNVRHFEFAVGKRVDDYMSDEQGKITWDRNHLLVTTVTYDNELFRNVYVISSLAKCLDTSTTATCLRLELSATPKMPLVNDIIVKTNVWDENRNAKQNFYNNGIDFVGNSENPLPYFNVVDGRNGITTIYTTDFTLEDQTHAIDMYGNTWTLTNNIWNKDYVAPNTSCDVSTYIGYDRTCPEFSLMKEGQALMAQQVFNSSDIQSTVGDSFAYEFPEQTDRLAGTQLGD
jgi:hypothetical protein